MVILLTYRNGSSALPNLKIRGGAKYKRSIKTRVELLRGADPVYEQGKEVRAGTIRQLYKEGKRVIGGVVQDNTLGAAYAASGALPKMIDRCRVRSKTHCDMAIDDTADVLKRILVHKGYGANDLLYEQCAESPKKVQVSTTIYWVEDGKKYSVYVDTIRVKKVIRTESTKLLPTYFTEFLDAQWTKTSVDKKMKKIRPSEDKTTHYWLTKHCEKRELTLDKAGFRHRYARQCLTYDYMINSDDIRKLREQVRLVRLTAGYENLY